MRKLGDYNFKPGLGKARLTGDQLRYGVRGKYLDLWEYLQTMDWEGSDKQKASCDQWEIDKYGSLHNGKNTSLRHRNQSKRQLHMG